MYKKIKKRSEALKDVIKESIISAQFWEGL